MIESASNTSRRRRQVWLARMCQRDACWVLEVTLKGSRIGSELCRNAPPVILRHNAAFSDVINEVTEISK